MWPGICLHFLDAKICEVSGFTLKALSLWIFFTVKSLKHLICDDWFWVRNANVCWYCWHRGFDTISLMDYTYIVAQIAYLSISAVQTRMFSLISNGRLDNTSTSLSVFPGWYFILKSKSTNSANNKKFLPTIYWYIIFANFLLDLFRVFFWQVFLHLYSFSIAF